MLHVRIKINKCREKTFECFRYVTSYTVPRAKMVEIVGTIVDFVVGQISVTK